MIKKQDESSALDEEKHHVGKTLTGENPDNQVKTENQIRMQGAGLRWDSNQGPQNVKGRERNH